MRTTIVPAQITTVEDKIAGNLNMTQIFLLLTPVFFGSIFYLVFPPQLHFSLYKIIFMLFIILISCTLALRIKGRVFIHWIVILLRYNNRPRYFIANKNDEYYRTIFQNTPLKQTKGIKKEQTKKVHGKKHNSIKDSEIFTLEEMLRHPAAQLSVNFAKEGKVYVTLSQNK